MIILFLLLLFFLFLGTPVAFAMLIPAFFNLVSNSIPIDVLVERMTTGLNSFPYLAIPFFIFAAEIMNSTGVTERIFNFALVLVGHFKGGLGHVNVLASMIFSGMSGSNTADAAGLGAIEIKAMVDKGYEPAYSAAITGVSSVIGPIIPPSVIMILYGVMAGVSAGKLFAAGIIPGLLLGFFMMIVIYYLTLKGKITAPVHKRASFKEVISAFRKGILPLLAPVIILGGILLGIVTPTEAGAIAVAYALFLGFLYREIKISELPALTIKAVKSTAVIMFIISVSQIFSWVVIVGNAGHKFIELVNYLDLAPWAALLFINIVLLILGCFIEGTALLIILVPVLTPLVQMLGISLVQFGVVMVLNLMIAFLSPPVGVGLFIVSESAEVPMEKVFKSMLIFYIPLLVVLFLLTYIPCLTMTLPKILF